ncbi:peptide deformylase [Gemella bergeri ATCC 700627]|uniref:Peptide deformylase n=1 Tax=Gemella bergeri ATCC 700627 TaxID=1321820 RepID=U2QV57_9BACL|nr:peptide deformylase [Gemella bergeri]ERK60416.1 peptide deformylase [Gemella bergeri ATCC 700627]
MITTKNIIIDPHDTLRARAKEVSNPISNEDKEILRNLLDYVIASQDDELAEKYGLKPGIGLAAPQINVSKRMIAVHIPNYENPEDTVSYALYNPKIISNSAAKCYLAGGEGCLSVEEQIQGYVPRYSKIKVVGYNENNEKITLSLTGLPAVCFQHEIDHLNGIMFYDHINKENPFSVPEDYEKL